VHRERIPFVHRFLLLQMEKEKNKNTTNYFLVGNPKNLLQANVEGESLVHDHYYEPP
jgi:hypothetical protein